MPAFFFFFFKMRRCRRLHFCFVMPFLALEIAFSDDSLSSIASTIDYTCRQSIGAEVDTVRRSLVFSGNEATITYEDPPNITSRALCDERLCIHSWHYANKETGYDVTARRCGDTITITGKKGSKTIQKSQVIDSLPWFQAMEFSLLSFLKGDAYSCAFWIIRPTDMKAFKMIARRKESESIQVNGQAQRAVKVTLSPSGILGRLWHATLWYRADDLSFLKSGMPRGIPGTSPTVVETIEIKQAKTFSID